MMKQILVLIGVVSSIHLNAQTGIGTSSPVNKFQVETNAAAPLTSGTGFNGHIRLGTTGANQVLDFGLGTTYGWFQARDKTGYGTNYNLILNPNGSAVGVGTYSPTSTLTVGNSSGTISGEITSNPQGTANEGGQITLKKSLTGSTVDWTIDQYGTSSTNARLRLFSGTTETNGINILENGNIGFGTIAPSSRLNIVGGGIRIHNGFSNSTSRPSINTGTIGNYEIRGVGSISGTSQTDAGDDGFLRLSVGGGTNSNSQTSIDLSGYSSVSDMNNNIVMRTQGAERMRMDLNGNIGLGTSSPGTNLHIENGNNFGNPAVTSSPSIYVYNNNASSSTANASITVRTNGTSSGNPFYSLDVNGKFGYSMGLDNANSQFVINSSWDFNLASANKQIIFNRTGQSRVIVPNSTGGYLSDWPSGWGGGFATYDITAGGIYYNGLSQRSDVRLKNTIQDIDNSFLNKYLNLRPVTYFWNQDKPRDTKLQYGLIAQEVESIFPEMVSTATDSMQTKSINYQALHALSLKAIQILNEKLEIQKQELNLLKQELEILKKYSKKHK